MTTGRHHMSRKVAYKVKAFDSGTARIVAYNRSVLTKPKGNPIVRCALGGVLAFVIAVSAVGTVAADPPEEPAVVVSVAIPVAATARPVEPVVMAPAPVVEQIPPAVDVPRPYVAPRRTVRRAPAVRVAPAPAPVRVETPAPVKDKPVKHRKKDSS